MSGVMLVWKNVAATACKKSDRFDEKIDSKSQQPAGYATDVECVRCSLRQTEEICSLIKRHVIKRRGIKRPIVLVVS